MSSGESCRGVEELLHRHQFLHDVVHRAGRAQHVGHGHAALAHRAPPLLVAGSGFHAKVRKNPRGGLEIARLANSMAGDPGHGGPGIQHLFGEDFARDQAPHRSVVLGDDLAARAGDPPLDTFEHYAIGQHRQVEDAQPAVGHCHRLPRER